MWWASYEGIDNWLVERVAVVAGRGGVALVLLGRQFLVEYDVRVEAHLNG